MKQLKLTFLFFILINMVGTKSYAHDIEVLNTDRVPIYYNFINGPYGKELYVTFRGDNYSSYSNEYKGNVVIPESVIYDEKVYPVTGISEYAFYGCTDLRNITIPKSVMSISDGAFNNCTGLTSISIPQSVMSIGSKAFYYCTGLTSISIPKSVTSIGVGAFSGCTGLTSILVAAGNSVYDSRYNCNAIIETYTNTLIQGCNKTVIPNDVTSIGNLAFYGCNGITTITIPNSLTSIGSNAFFCCTGLTKVIINNIAAWCNFSFNNQSDNPLYYAKHLYSNEYTEITSLVIPNGVTSIGKYAFSNCESLTSVDIPSSAINIRDCAFYNCKGLTSMRIPNHVANIGSGAFSGCSGLNSIEIPNSVTSIGSSAFRGCSTLTSVTIGNGVTSIEDRAFEDCSSLTSITIGNGVTSIGYYAFSGCDKIETLSLDCASVGTWFQGKTSIKNVIIGKNVTSIGASAFSGCSGLISIEIPNSVTSIGNYAFYGCNLTSVTIDSNNIISKNYQSNNNLYTIFGEVKDFIIGNNVTSIGEEAFSGYFGLISVTIPNSVTSIGYYAFVECNDLKKVIIKDIAAWCNISFETPKSNPLYYASHLYCDENTEIINLVIPDGITKIGGIPFCYCHSVNSVIIPNSVVSIDNWAFHYCQLTSVVILNETPFDISSDVFWNRKNAILYVPMGCKSAYEKANNWKEFKEIKEGIPSEIKAIENDQTTEVLETGNLYTLDGRRLSGKPTKRGIYIVNGRKIVVK